MIEDGPLAEVLRSGELPSGFDDLFGELYDIEANRFLIQESTILDFKNGIPARFTDDYGACIIRLALGLHNSFGGLIVFGVQDRALNITGERDSFDIESFNRCLSDFTGARLECQLRSYDLIIDGETLRIPVVLVPQRTAELPVALAKPLGPYKAGTLWVRERHEVLEVESRHLPLIYSSRQRLNQRGTSTRVHRSLPPSPATMQDFIGRFELLKRLWAWTVSGNTPRIYLHGPGGSGKSTIAFEFARSVSDAEYPIKLDGGDQIDFVIYLSGKETEFNPLDQTEKPFQLLQFSSASEQFLQILYHSGLSTRSELGQLDGAQLLSALSELLDNFSGLIILDDIDALSRRNKPTGEEELFLKTALAAKKTRVLYTLRYAPAYALTSSLEVPGLDEEREYFAFVEACASQFDVPPPAPDYMIRIAEQTERLPLLIETVMGLRRTSSNYSDALSDFRERGGDAARRYLYQREYDRLDGRGKSRQLLAALMLIDAPMSFRSLCDILPNIPREQVRDAITETKGIFLRTDQTVAGDTLYELAEPSFLFVEGVSASLPYIQTLTRSVEHYKKEIVKMSPDEAAALARVEGLVRQRRYAEVADYNTTLREDDPVKVNPRFLGALGQSFAELGPENAEKARECFRRAYALRDRNIFTLRSWYYLDLRAPHTVPLAEELCRLVVGDEEISLRHRSEFYSKLGRALDQQATPHAFTNREKAVDLWIKSINAYLEAAWLAQSVPELDGIENEKWLTQTTARFFRSLGNDPEPIFQLIESWANNIHDIEIYSARAILEPIASSVQRVAASQRPKFTGLAKRTLGRLDKLPRKVRDEAGFQYVLDMLRKLTSL